MKRIAKHISIFCFSLLLAACSDNAVTDVFTNIPKQNWSYDRPVKVVTEIIDPSKSYNIYINFRHTDDYRYANVWMRIKVIGPDKKSFTERKEFVLALPDGEWIGKGSGNLYNYRLIFKENYKFSVKGSYTFIIEQNMRDNPLKAIADVGLRVEPAL